MCVIKLNQKGAWLWDICMMRPLDSALNVFHYTSTHRKKMCDPKEELAYVGEVLRGKARTKTLNNQKLHLIHEYVLMNSVATQAFIW
jgi:hypothetical protein